MFKTRFSLCRTQDGAKEVETYAGSRGDIYRQTGIHAHTQTDEPTHIDTKKALPQTHRIHGRKKRINACVFPKRSSWQKDDGEHTLPLLKLKMSKRTQKNILAWYKNKILWPDLSPLGYVSRKCTQIQGPSQFVSSGNI